jgi:hypothetical protein
MEARQLLPSGAQPQGCNLNSVDTLAERSSESPQRRAVIPSHLLAWVLLALVNIVATAIEPLPKNGLKTRLVMLAFDAGQLLAIGLAIEIAVRLGRRFLPKAAWGWGVLVVLSMLLAALTLPEDLAGFVETFV